MNSLKDSISRIEAWMQKNLSSPEVKLSSPATESELNEFLLTLDQEVPADFINLYKTCNGELGQFGPGFFLGLNFLNLSEVLNHWVVMSRYIDKFEDYVDFSSTPKHAIKTSYMTKGWIPIFTDHAGNYIGIDLEPGEQGNYGQVINFGRDEDDKKVLASSIRDLFKWYANQLEEGKCLISGKVDSFIHLPSSHSFFTSIKEASFRPNA